MKKMFHLFLMALCAVLFWGSARGQEEFVEPPAKRLTRLNFRQLTGGIVMLKGQVGGKEDSLNFILDTGSGGISLDSLTVLELGLKTEPSDKTIRGIAGIRKVGFVYNQSLHLKNMTVNGLDYHVNDYSILSSVYGERIDGIIGYSVLSRYLLYVNYDSLYIDFYEPGTLRYPKGGYHLKPFIATLPIQNMRIRDDATINTRFLYDMGAGLCLMLTTDFVKDSALIKSKRKRFVKEAEGLGGKIDMEVTVVREIKIGPYKFRNVPTYIFDDEYNVTSYPYLGGLIGNDLLRRFNVYLNYAKRDFYIVPNSHFNDQFDYSYSGIELYYVDGVIIVGDVAINSPAEAAGIKEGDIVVGVNKSFSQNLQQYKEALQTPGQKARMVIKRNDELLEFEFKIKSIL